MSSVDSIQKKRDFERLRRGILSVPFPWQNWETLVDLRAFLTTFRDRSEFEDFQIDTVRHVVDVMEDDAPDCRTEKRIHFRNLKEEYYHEKCLSWLEGGQRTFLTSWTQDVLQQGSEQRADDVRLDELYERFWPWREDVVTLIGDPDTVMSWHDLKSLRSLQSRSVIDPSSKAGSVGRLIRSRIVCWDFVLSSILVCRMSSVVTRLEKQNTVTYLWRTSVTEKKK